MAGDGLLLNEPEEAIRAAIAPSTRPLAPRGAMDSSEGG